ncbi:trypsin-like peptidase domain-containing protein [Mycolicibacterium sp. S2-37]|uniref:trypsin-like serine peptidase n=1 Tax=Mycolicibacterium sp. S2-37 TaxID=2810297 RepID=UPI001A942754|nr:trypsin-like peptidase domain-containing protein [Mycolicibacterium sp. S2-37]MBO0676994.1 trypsin-like peptidase domain-containing protein [Mycolicibacterium sp. S2-37]
MGLQERGLAAVLAIVGPALLPVACARPPANPDHVAAPPAIAAPVQPDPRIGALYPGDGPEHTCSASVLDTTGGDLILTAAHCLAGDPDATFLPGLSDGSTPDRTHVEAAYFDPRWLSDQDPRADFAILRLDGDVLGPHRGVTLGTAPPPGTPVLVRGYAGGDGSTPLGCRASTAQVVGFPELPCAGLVAGLSGAPWMVGSTVVGLVGGLDGGGCDDDLSYSPPFDTAITRLLARAEAGGTGDVAPDSEGEGCSAELSSETG